MGIVETKVDGSSDQQGGKTIVRSGHVGRLLHRWGSRRQNAVILTTVSLANKGDNKRVGATVINFIIGCFPSLMQAVVQNNFNEVCVCVCGPCESLFVSLLNV